MARKTKTKRTSKRLRIGLVYDLRDDYLAMGYGPEEVGEFDSISTINELDKALTSLGYRVERIGHGRRLAELLVAGRRWDLVFTIAEGLYGRSREAQVPALLELYGQLYTFSDPAGLGRDARQGRRQAARRRPPVSTRRGLPSSNGPPTCAASSWPIRSSPSPSPRAPARAWTPPRGSTTPGNWRPSARACSGNTASRSWSRNTCPAASSPPPSSAPAPTPRSSARWR